LQWHEQILAQRETHIADAFIIGSMRSLAIYLTLLLLLALSVGAGIIASDWPTWCRRAQWCAADWPQHR